MTIAHSSLFRFIFHTVTVFRVGSSIIIFACIEKIDIIKIIDFFVYAQDGVSILKFFAFRTVIHVTLL